MWSTRSTWHPGSTRRALPPFQCTPRPDSYACTHRHDFRPRPYQVVAALEQAPVLVAYSRGRQFVFTPTAPGLAPLFACCMQTGLIYPLSLLDVVVMFFSSLTLLKGKSVNDAKKCISDVCRLVVLRYRRTHAYRPTSDTRPELSCALLWPIPSLARD